MWKKQKLLSVIDTIKTIGSMGIALRGHWDNSKYHPDVREPSEHDRLSNLLELVSLTTTGKYNSTGTPKNLKQQGNLHF